MQLSTKLIGVNSFLACKPFEQLPWLYAFAVLALNPLVLSVLTSVNVRRTHLPASNCLFHTHGLWVCCLLCVPYASNILYYTKSFNYITELTPLAVFFSVNLALRILSTRVSATITVYISPWKRRENTSPAYFLLSVRQHWFILAIKRGVLQCVHTPYFHLVLRTGWFDSYHIHADRDLIFFLFFRINF